MATQYQINNPASFNQAGQGVGSGSFNISLPDDGQVFRGSGDYGSALYMRKGNQIISLNLLDPSISGGGSSAGDQANNSIQSLKARGLDYNSLPAYNMADVIGYGGKFGLDVSASKTTNPAAPQYLPNVTGSSANDLLAGYITANQQYNSSQAEQAKAAATSASQSKDASKAVTPQSSQVAAMPNPQASPTTSITDFLKQQNLPTSFQFRNTLAKQAGINNYTGSAAENVKLLNLMQSGAIKPPTVQAPESSLAPASNKPLGTDLGTPTTAISAPVGSQPGSTGQLEISINEKMKAFFESLGGGGTTTA